MRRLTIGKAVIFVVFALGFYGFASILLASGTEDRCVTTTRPVPAEASGSRMERSLLIPVRWTCIYRDDYGTELERRTMWLWTD
jgi:hypothetical protein